MLLKLPCVCVRKYKNARWHCTFMEKQDSLFRVCTRIFFLCCISVYVVLNCIAIGRIQIKLLTTLPFFFPWFLVSMDNIWKSKMCNRIGDFWTEISCLTSFFGFGLFLEAIDRVRRTRSVKFSQVSVILSTKEFPLHDPLRQADRRPQRRTGQEGSITPTLWARFNKD